jgi:hypothetical protein
VRDGSSGGSPPKQRCAAVFLTALVVTVMMSASWPSAIRAATPTWHRVPAPNGAAGGYALNDVVATSTTDAWAVGSVAGRRRQTFAMHWDGRAWSRVPTPNRSVPSADNELLGVAATSASNAWAVGSTYDHGVTRTLILHWNGTRWTRVPSPNPGGNGYDSLEGVAATSASDAWAVGEYDKGGIDRPLTLHWDGLSWSKVRSPTPSGSYDYAFLDGVAATSASDVWAVGFASGKPSRSIVLHWDGTAWTQVPSPSPGAKPTLFGVAVAGPSDVWAVGYHFHKGTIATLVLHWNGRLWTKVSSPNPGGDFSYNLLSDVAAVSPTNVWAVGQFDYSAFSSRSGHQHTLILHWDGRSWSRVPSPNQDASTADNWFNGVAATSASDVWAVGNSVTAPGYRTLVAHCC